MKFFLALLFHSIIVVSPLLTCAAQIDGKMIASIAFIGERNGGEIVYFYLSNEIQPKTFELTGKKPRMVLDFQDTDYEDKKQKVIKTDGKYIKKIRIGIHQQPVAKTRVVFDLGEGHDYSLKKRFLDKQNILEVTVTPAENIPEKETITGNVQEKPADPYHLTKEPVSAPPVGEKDEDISDTSTKVSSSKGAVTLLKKEQEDVTTVQNEKPKSSGQPPAQLFSHVETGSEEFVGEEPHVLLDLNFERNMGGKEMVRFKLNGFYPPVVFAIDNENLRVVCDFLDAELGPGVERVMETDGRYIKRVRVAKHSSPDKVRVVLDLATQENYDLKQIFFKDDNIFVVILSVLENS